MGAWTSAGVAGALGAAQGLPSLDPVAALGLLGSFGPLVAGIAMGMSSVSVVANSLRMSLRMRRHG